MQPAARLDIVIPVFNEGRNILATLAALARDVRTPARVLICYDLPDDDTLPAIRARPDAYAGLAVEFVRNPAEAARLAAQEQKLTFVLHVSGNFDDAGLT